jgi:serine/threonine-protein kinase
MAVSFEQFVRNLEQSGLISPCILEAACEKLPPGRQLDVKELARELVRQNVLTKYQVQEVHRGNAKNIVLGNYTILDQIGQGGMGQVFKAKHGRMDRFVAIKMLPAGVTKQQAAVARFQREVKAAAKLEHPNIVAAYDADEANGRRFLVMQYVEGQDLSALVKSEGPLPMEQAVSCILQAARGLEYAHRRGVVHRDIKPANLLLDQEGTLKILDMGLARLESAAGAERDYCDAVRAANLSGTHVTDTGMAHLQGLTGLEWFGLNFTQVTDAGLAHLQGLTRLQSLFLEGTQVTDAGMAHLQRLTGLEWLVLTDTQVTDGGLAHLQGLTRLQVLHLSGTQVTDPGMAHLQGLTRLEWLTLDGTHVTDAGLAHVHGLTGLQHLALVGTHVTDAGLAHLQGLTRLQVLYLSGTHVTDSGLAQIRKALPNCRVLTH